MREIKIPGDVMQLLGWRPTTDKELDEMLRAALGDKLSQDEQIIKECRDALTGEWTITVE